MTHTFLSVKSAETGVLVLEVSLTTHQTVGPGCPGLGATQTLATLRMASCKIKSGLANAAILTLVYRS